MLTVYRASAGAGKTHKLTGEYLTLLFTGPGAFRRILAVTFTNKATDEMKTRIVDELYNLASGRKSDYVELLKSTYSLTEVQVRKQAAKILIDILHDYSAFNISTIDRFFSADHACLYTRDWFTRWLWDRDGPGAGAHNSNR